MVPTNIANYLQFKQYPIKNSKIILRAIVCKKPKRPYQTTTGPCLLHDPAGIVQSIDLTSR